MKPPLTLSAFPPSLTPYQTHCPVCEATLGRGPQLPGAWGNDPYPLSYTFPFFFVEVAMAKISQLEIGVISVKTPLQAERCWSPPVLAHESVVKLPVIL